MSEEGYWLKWMPPTTDARRDHAHKASRTFDYADRYAAMSKSFNECGHPVEELPLSVRTWRCPGCGTFHDRDVSSVRNILKFAVTFGKGEETYPDACDGVNPLGEAALASLVRGSVAARTENRLPPFREGPKAEELEDPRAS